MSFCFLKKSAYSWLLSLSCFYFLLTFFFWQGYSCLLSFSCCQLLLMSFMVLSIKVTHDFWVSHVFVSCSLFWIRLLMRGFFDSKATHAFWVSHVVICCSWVVFFHEGCSWFLSFSCFYFLFIFLNRLLIFLARLLMPFGFLMVSFVAREFLVVCFVFFFIGYSWLLRFSWSLFFVAHEFLCFFS